MAFHEGEAGVIRLAVINVEGIVDDEGTVAQLAFQPRHDRSSATVWTVASLSLYDLAGELLTDVEEASKTETPVPMKCALYPNTPNPFNATTTIRFSVPEAPTSVHLDIYDLLGQRVRTLVDREVEAGTYAVRWDGRDELGRNVSSGVYLVQLMVDEGRWARSRKITLMR